METTEKPRARAGSAPISFATKHSWMVAVLAAPDLPAGARVVGVRLMLFAHLETGRCDPAIATLAKAVAMTPRGVEKNLTALANAGWLAWERGHGRRANAYRFTMGKASAGATFTEQEFDADPNDSSDNGRLATNAGSGVGGTYPEPQFGATPNSRSSCTELPDALYRTPVRVAPNQSSHEHSEQGDEQGGEQGLEQGARFALRGGRDSIGFDPSDLDRNAAEPTGSLDGELLAPGDVEAGFRTFWQTYPLRVAKKDAAAAFRAAVEGGASAAEIVAAAERYARRRAREIAGGDQPRFTKHPKNWIGARAWEDEPEEETAAPRGGAPRQAGPFGYIGQFYTPEQIEASFAKYFREQDDE